MRPAPADCMRCSRFRSLSAHQTGPAPASVQTYCISPGEADTAFCFLSKWQWHAQLHLPDNWKCRHTMPCPGEPYQKGHPSSPPEVSPGPGGDDRRYQHNPDSCASGLHPDWTSDIFWSPSFRKAPARSHSPPWWIPGSAPGKTSDPPERSFQNFPLPFRYSAHRNCLPDRNA